ncbi:4F2 cell-surface antigen heavy chain-like [Hippocampus comes]|uniref:4F2 cell-surface antigen heavy chain-like n=1 Tax=Hippocampus comes TaxID=109280 RepID=UPI00094E919F|nr:PREDICTED: 4F2 cell-surface antigen heavy chain-like [Hippocampus comes]
MDRTEDPTPNRHQAVAEMQDAASEADRAPPPQPDARRDEAADADATEADVSEVLLDRRDEPDAVSEKQEGKDGQEKRAVNGAEAQSEKNGCVKVKMEQEEQEKFTGLNKEELLRVAGTPGWVRTRWALLVLFWLGWLGMLGGAVLLILQAPRCRDRPATHWWNRGALYHVPSVHAFTDAGDIRGVQQKVDALSKLKFKGLVIGPVHVAPPDDAIALSFQEIAADAGSLEQFKDLVRVAHRKGERAHASIQKGIFVFCGRDAARAQSGGQRTPPPPDAICSDKYNAMNLQPALVFWFGAGVDGVQLADVEHVAAAVPSLWADIWAIVQNGTNERPTRRLLMGSTERRSAAAVSALLSSTGVDLLTSGVLPEGDASELARSVLDLYAAHSATGLAWNLGGRGAGHLASLVGPALAPLYQLLLFTLPGTPVLQYGDEIGLMDEGTKFPRMIWDSPGGDEEQELNATLKVNDCKRKMKLAEVVLATAGAPAAGARVNPASLRLGAGQAMLLKFPYGG